MPWLIMAPGLVLCIVSCVLGDVETVETQVEADDSLQRLARWQYEWHVTAETVAEEAEQTALANYMTETWMGCDLGLLGW